MEIDGNAPSNDRQAAQNDEIRCLVARNSSASPT